MTELLIDEHRVSPRKVLKHGSIFRLKRGSGPLNVHTGENSGLRSGLYRCRYVWRDRDHPDRVYCQAVFETSGCEHTVYLSGPYYRSGDLLVQPYRVHVFPENRRKERRHGRRKLIRR